MKNKFHTSLLMKNKFHTSLLSLAALAMSIGSANAAAVIYEPFDYDAGNLGAVGGSTGLNGTWGANRAGVKSGDLSFAGLETTTGTNYGGKTSNRIAGGAGAGADSIGTAGLLADGATLWFSALVDTTTINASTGRAYVGIGTTYVDGFGRYGANGSGDEGIGFVLENKTLSTHAWYSNGGQSVASGTLLGTGTQLIVGRITWGALGETIDLYTPSGDLSSAGTAVATMTTTINLDQLGATLAADKFDTATFGGTGDSTDSYYAVDDMRYGASYLDVVPVPEPSTTLLGALGFLALLRRRR